MALNRGNALVMFDTDNWNFITLPSSIGSDRFENNLIGVI